MSLLWLSKIERICIDCSIKFVPTGVSQSRCVECGKINEINYDKNYARSDRGKLARHKYDRTIKAKEKYKRYRSKDAYRLYTKSRYHEIEENVKKARYYVSNAIRDGRLKKLNYCEKCGRKDWGEKRSMIEAHHYMGYEPENWLKIQWLCTDCHKLSEREG